ncbi:hypothetical protein F5Y13DRAFT_158543 [Hypoxylon sp. FL1857]|nr:hypothetical protein F5Y13DRAFT_158543 [Hypoxylon sp. FL1857]
MSTRLAMMGTSDDEAKPHIIIFCQSSHKNLIQRFIKQDIVADVCRPPDSDVPSFEVLVLGDAPRLRTAESDIKIVAEVGRITTEGYITLCGMPISFQCPSGQRQNATFGGIIKVVTAQGEVELYGITSGHALRKWDHDGMMKQDDTSFNESQLSGLTHEDTRGVNTMEVNSDDFGIHEKLLALRQLLGSPGDTESWLWESNNSTVIGQIFDVARSCNRSGTKQYYDWAIFRPMVYQMNYLPSPMGKEEHFKISDRRPGATGARSIFVLSGSMGCKEGVLLPEPGRILLDDGEEFVDSFMITVDGSGIHDGDSGSWVVDTTSFEVYGQLIASDVLGGGYVVTMTDIFDDIKSQLGAQNVVLPELADIIQAKVVAGGNSSTNVQRSKSTALSSTHDSGYISMNAASQESLQPSAGRVVESPPLHYLLDDNEGKEPRRSRLSRLLSRWKRKSKHELGGG